jgi:hypothetical protein
MLGITSVATAIDCAKKQQWSPMRVRWWPRGLLRTPLADCGATAAEYALMVGLIATVIVVAVMAFGESVSALFVLPAGLP